MALGQMENQALFPLSPIEIDHFQKNIRIHISGCIAISAAQGAV